LGLLQRLQKQLFPLWDEIGFFPGNENSELQRLLDPIELDLSENLLNIFTQQVTNSSQTLNQMKETINDTKIRIVNLLKELYIRNENFSDTDLYCTNFANSSLAKKKIFEIHKFLQKRKEELENEKHQRITACEKSLGFIHRLWDLLQIPENERNRFLELKDKFQSYSLEQIKECKNEQKRLEILSEKKLQEFITKAQEKLTKLWSELHMSSNQVDLFLSSVGDSLTLDRLTTMNNEIKFLENRLVLMGPLLKLIIRREWFKGEMKVFEQRASDVNRLFGSSNQLLDEEKFRKSVAREFPKLTTTLSVQITEWEISQKSTFFFEGRPYKEIMKEEKEQPNFELLHLKLLTNDPLHDQKRKSLTLHKREIVTTPLNNRTTPSISTPQKINKSINRKSTPAQATTPIQISNSKMPLTPFPGKEKGLPKRN